MKLLLAIGSLRAGGAERVLSLLASEFARRGYEVTLVTFSRPSEDFFRVDPAVRRISIELEGTSRGMVAATRRNLSRIRALRAAFIRYEPDVVLSFLTTMNVLAAFASYGKSHVLVLSERTDPSQYALGRIWETLRRYGYSRAATLVVQTESVADWFRKAFKVPPPRLAVIPNPLTPGVLRASKAGDDKPESYVLGVGRLEHEKGFDLLVDAFAQAGLRKDGIQLWIAGGGSQLELLQCRAAHRGIADSVRFLGEVRDPAALMRRAKVFVLPSRFEGFPNALLEAMASGAPCVAADCRSGPRELLGADDGGLLVPVNEVSGLALAIRRLVDDSELAMRLANKGRRIASGYELSEIASRWEQVFRESIHL